MSHPTGVAASITPEWATREYDAVIVGGRVAGCSLAIRVAKAGLSVLLLERGRHPSKHPASSPIIYPSALKLLDELGADETKYAAGTPRLTRYVYQLRGAFTAYNAVTPKHGRDYAYAIDRARLDHTLWQLAAAEPNVTAIEQAAFKQTAGWDDNTQTHTIDIRVKGKSYQIKSRLLIGADGRFSSVARIMNANAYSQVTRMPTNCLYAYWDNVNQFDEHGPSIHLVSPKHGLGMLIMESADGSTAVTIEGQSKLLTPPNDTTAADHYLEILKSAPRVWSRLESASMVTKVHGMKQIGNLYRQAGGEGWVLVGDAIHQKDPIDGQGIYDALATSKLLAQQLIDWHNKQKVWADALDAYKSGVQDETKPMYRSTLISIYEHFYLPMPQWGFNTIVRWLYQDKIYMQRLARLLGRDHDNPLRWRTLGTILGAVWRGFKNDLRRLKIGR